MNNNIVRFGLAAAAIALVLIVGIQFLPGGNMGGDPTPTPEPAASALPVIGGGLAPGTYVMSDVDAPIRTLVRFTFTLPAGWDARSEDLFISKQGDTSAQLGFVPWVVTHVYADACQSEGTLTEIGPTVDDLVAALVDQPNSDATTPTDVEVGGYPAKLVTMSIPTDLDLSTCRHPELLIQIWANPEETDFFAIPAVLDNPVADPVNDVYIVDVEGERVVILAGHTTTSTAADIAELEAIIASIRFEP